MNIRVFIKNFTFITIPTIIILLLFFEVVFRTVLPASKRPMYLYDTLYKINRNNLTEPDGYWTMGKWCKNKTHWHINNFGWNSAIDYKAEKTSSKKRICIIGDSYIEALSVDVNKNIAAKIRDYEGKNYEVYSFGFGGAPLSQYLQMSRYVKEVFSPDILVILLHYNDFDESLAKYLKEPSNMHLRIENDSCIEEFGRVPLSVKRYLLKSATVRYLEYNLLLRVFLVNLLNRKDYMIKEFNANIDVNSVLKRKPELMIATDYCIRKIKEENPSTQIIFLMNAPQNDIYLKRVNSSNVMWINRMAKEIVDKNGLPFIDLTYPFEEHYKKHHQVFDYGKLDGHWNELGHDIAAKEVIKYLKSNTN